MLTSEIQLLITFGVLSLLCITIGAIIISQNYREKHKINSP